MRRGNVAERIAIIVLVLGSALALILLGLLFLRDRDQVSAELVAVQASEQTSAVETPLAMATTAPPVPQESCTITANGDVLIHLALINGAKKADGNYDFSFLFRYKEDFFGNADYKMFDMEGTLSGPPFAGYPSFSAPDVLAQNLKAAGYHAAVTANNHAMDYDIKGAKRTAKTLQDAGLDVVGTRANHNDPKHFIKTLNGIRVGFTAWTYETPGNGIPGHRALNGLVIPQADEALIDSFDQQQGSPYVSRDQKLMADRIAQMRKDGAEMVVVYMHWGAEYAQKPGPMQRTYAKALADAGVDVVFGCGPHVLQAVESVKSADGKHEMLCYFSMGNFLSNQQFETGDVQGAAQDGIVAMVRFKRNTAGKAVLAAAGYVPSYMYKTYPAKATTVGYPIPVKAATEQVEQYQAAAFVNDMTASLARIRSIMVQNVAGSIPIQEFGTFKDFAALP